MPMSQLSGRLVEARVLDTPAREGLAGVGINAGVGAVPIAVTARRYDPDGYRLPDPVTQLDLWVERDLGARPAVLEVAVVRGAVFLPEGFVHLDTLVIPDGLSEYVVHVYWRPGS